MPEEEKLDVEGAIEAINAALRLQYRSALQYTLASGSLFGFEYQSLGDQLWEYGRAELDDARMLVEKVVALGGDPTTEVAELNWTGKPDDAVQWLIETEEEAVDTLQAAIEPTGREGRSEALEHTPRARDHAQAGPGRLPAARRARPSLLEPELGAARGATVARRVPARPAPAGDGVAAADAGLLGCSALPARHLVPARLSRLPRARMAAALRGRWRSATWLAACARPPARAAPALGARMRGRCVGGEACRGSPMSGSSGGGSGGRSRPGPSFAISAQARTAAARRPALCQRIRRRMTRKPRSNASPLNQLRQLRCLTCICRSTSFRGQTPPRYPRPPPMTLESREYELVLLIDPGLEDAARDSLADEVRKRIESDGKLKHADSWGLRKLAYEIEQRTEADYRWLRFEAQPQLLDQLDHNLKIADGVLRFRIFRVDPNSPVVAPPASGAPAPAARREDARTPADASPRQPPEAAAEDPEPAS